MFNALLLTQSDTDGFRCSLQSMPDDALPELPSGGVLVRPAWSTLNYKDALALTNRGPVVRRWPMVPGIDGAGEVLESAHPDWRPGDRFLLNGWGVGETHWGCLAQRARLHGDWLLPLPEGLSPRDAMVLGTAGYTAALCVQALERHGLAAGDAEVLVTGASGGVGSVAVALLAKAGHRVVAATGKLEQADYLQALGAARVIDRAELAATGKPLQKERWAAAVDSVGGDILANVLAQTRYGGAVAACGLAQSAALNTTVMPFILRGVSLLGIDSVMAPRAARTSAWQRLAHDMAAPVLARLAQEISLAEAPAAARALMEGRQTGRWVVNLA